MSFPTTLWSTIQAAGGRDAQAMERFALRYRPAVRSFLQMRGYAAHEADDICQDVFVRVLAGNVLAKADPQRGRFRSLLLAVTRHVIGDRGRKQRRDASQPLELDPSAYDADRDEGFDRAWMLHLAESALVRLEAQGSVHVDVLRRHLAGESQDRHRLWIARRKLVAAIRSEVAETCSSHRQFEQEVAYLSSFLRPQGVGPKK